MSLTSFIRSYSTWNIHLTFFCLSHIPQQNSAKVKYHKVIFLGWVKTYCPTVPETKVNMWTEAPNYSEPKTRSCLSLWPPSPLWATGSTHHLPSHVGLQAVPGTLKAHSRLGPLMWPLPRSPGYLSARFTSDLMRILLPPGGQSLSPNENYKHLSLIYRHQQAVQSPPLLYSSYHFRHTSEDPSHPHPQLTLTQLSHLPICTNRVLLTPISPKNWGFWIVVLEKTLESPLDSKEIKPVNPESRKSTLNIHWKDWCWNWSFSTLATWCKKLSLWKRPWCWEDWGQEEKGMTEDEMVGQHHWVDGQEFEQTPGVGEGQGSLACCSSWGRQESDTTERLN